MILFLLGPQLCWTPCGPGLGQWFLSGLGTGWLVWNIVLPTVSHHLFSLHLNFLIWKTGRWDSWLAPQSRVVVLWWDAALEPSQDWSLNHAHQWRQQYPVDKPWSENQRSGAPSWYCSSHSPSCLQLPQGGVLVMRGPLRAPTLQSSPSSPTGVERSCSSYPQTL